jgi:autotransporter-associated beta strand protein
MKPPSLAFLTAAGLATACLLTVLPAHGQTVWLGADSNSFNAAANWSAGLPSASVAAEFNASSTSNLSLSVGTAISALGIIVKDPAGPLSIAPAANQRLTVGSEGIDMSAATQDMTISTDVANAFNAGQTWTVADGRTLTISRPGFSPPVNNGAEKLTIAGPGSVSFIGTTWDIATASNANLEVDGGNLAISNNLRFGISASSPVAGSLTIKNGGSVTTTGFVQLSGGSATSSGSLTLLDGTLTTTRIAKGSGLSSIEIDGGTLRARASDVIYIPSTHGTVSIGAGGLTFDSNGNVNLRIESILQDKPGTSGGLTKAGQGNLAIVSNSTYSGPTTVQEGSLVVRGSVTSDITVKSGASLQSNAVDPTLFNMATYGQVTVEAGGTLQRSSFKQMTGGLNLQSSSRFTITVSSETTPLPVTGGTLSAREPVQVSIYLPLAVEGEPQPILLPGTYPLINFSGATPDLSADSFVIEEAPEGLSYSFAIDGSALNLIVTEAPASLFRSWAIAFGLDPDQEGAPLADHDGDGLANLVEFALALDPTAHDSLPAPQLVDGFLELAYTRSIAASAEVTVVAQTAPDLQGPWTTDEVTDTLVATSNDIEERVARVAAEGHRRFLRLAVEKR